MGIKKKGKYHAYYPFARYASPLQNYFKPCMKLSGTHPAREGSSGRGTFRRRTHFLLIDQQSDSVFSWLRAKVSSGILLARIFYHSKQNKLSCFSRTGFPSLCRLRLLFSLPNICHRFDFTRNCPNFFSSTVYSYSSLTITQEASELPFSYKKKKKRKEKEGRECIG